MKQVVLISSSPSATSRLNGMLATLDRCLTEYEAKLQRVEIREISAEALVRLQFDHPNITEAMQWLEQADAVIVATPVYKASFSGLLKLFLDLIPQKGLKDKKILPVAIGGTAAHLLMIDYALKPVLAALGAETQLQGVFAVDTQIERMADGEFKLDEELLYRLRASVASLVS